jgi:hypothetical protein
MASLRVLPFKPAGATTVAAATAASSSTAIDAHSMAVRIYNAGAVTIFVSFSTGGETVTVTNGMPIPALGIGVFTKGSADRVNIICASATASVYLTPGEGL